MSAKHYQPTRGEGGTWQFTTPTGESCGHWSKTEAERIAAITEGGDRLTALNGTGPLAETLRGHFFPEEVKP
jgi:hypothetical protein